jgi:hypothetical protein
MAAGRETSTTTPAPARASSARTARGSWSIWATAAVPINLAAGDNDVGHSSVLPPSPCPSGTVATCAIPTNTPWPAGSGTWTLAIATRAMPRHSGWTGRGYGLLLSVRRRRAAVGRRRRRHHHAGRRGRPLRLRRYDGLRRDRPGLSARRWRRAAGRRPPVLHSDPDPVLRRCVLHMRDRGRAGSGRHRLCGRGPPPHDPDQRALNDPG